MSVTLCLSVIPTEAEESRAACGAQEIALVQLNVCRCAKRPSCILKTGCDPSTTLEFPVQSDAKKFAVGFKG
jgi:hypothetical protein